MSATFPIQGLAGHKKMSEPMDECAVLGLHHMTAISGPAQENLDFYGEILGLRLVKLTVNFDDPSAHHLYYGNGSGEPGTILTFFPYPNGYPGRPGTGQVTVTSLAIPMDSIGYWQDRFMQSGVDADRVQKRSGSEILPFRGPDGLLLELATTPSADLEGWNGSQVRAEHAIRGMRALIIRSVSIAPLKKVLTELLGFRQTDERDRRFRFEVGAGGVRKTIEVIEDPIGPNGRSGHGTVHHVAFRTSNEASLKAARDRIADSGLHVSPIMNREYFKSIYFREPGGVLFEVATDPPGFTVDEPYEQLGTLLRLPAQYEHYRGKIEKELPVLRLPKPL